jgi:hypothetical protein
VESPDPQVRAEGVELPPHPPRVDVASLPLVQLKRLVPRGARLVYLAEGDVRMAEVVEVVLPMVRRRAGARR